MKDSKREEELRKTATLFFENKQNKKEYSQKVLEISKRLNLKPKEVSLFKDLSAEKVAYDFVFKD